MSLAADKSPQEYLYEIEQRCLRYARPLPQQADVKVTWDGVGFRIGGIHLVTGMEEVKEILQYPLLTKVPGAKSWVLGISNVRGNLLPILDLFGFLSGESSQLSRNSRVLVLQHMGISAGLLVDEVFGMKHFPEEERVHDNPVFGSRIDRFIKETYKQGGELWWVFDLHALVENPEFMRVAA